MLATSLIMYKQKISYQVNCEASLCYTSVLAIDREGLGVRTAQCSSLTKQA